MSTGYSTCTSRTNDSNRVTGKYQHNQPCVRGMDRYSSRGSWLLSFLGPQRWKSMPKWSGDSVGYCVFATNLGSVAPGWATLEVMHLALEVATSEVWQRRVKSFRWIEVLQGCKQGMAISIKKITVSAVVGGPWCAPWKHPLLAGVDLLALLDRLESRRSNDPGPGSFAGSWWLCTLWALELSFGFSRRLRRT
jgi:hypothetical protein